MRKENERKRGGGERERGREGKRERGREGKREGEGEGEREREDRVSMRKGALRVKENDKESASGGKRGVIGRIG